MIDVKQEMAHDFKGQTIFYIQLEQKGLNSRMVVLIWAGGLSACKMQESFYPFNLPRVQRLKLSSTTELFCRDLAFRAAMHSKTFKKNKASKWGKANSSHHFLADKLFLSLDCLTVSEQQTGWRSNGEGRRCSTWMLLNESSEKSKWIENSHPLLFPTLHARTHMMALFQAHRTARLGTKNDECEWYRESISSPIVWAAWELESIHPPAGWQFERMGQNEKGGQRWSEFCSHPPSLAQRWKDSAAAGLGWRGWGWGWREVEQKSCNWRQLMSKGCKIPKGVTWVT